MATGYVNHGYAPANPYQCPTNLIKSPECEKCAPKPVCQSTYTGAISAPIAGFRHSAWVTDDCVDVKDGIVKFKSGPIDISAAGYSILDLQKAVVSELMKHDIPESHRLNRDVHTKILECAIKLDMADNGDGTFTITHTSKHQISAFVDADGNDVVLMGEYKCNRIEVCSYEQYFETGVLQADIEAAITAAGLTFESVTVEVGSVPANGTEPAYDKVTIETASKPFEFEFGGKSFDFCGQCRCVYKSDDELDNAKKISSKQATSERKVSEKAKSLASENGINIDDIEGGNITVKEVKAAIAAKG